MTKPWGLDQVDTNTGFTTTTTTTTTIATPLATCISSSFNLLLHLRRRNIKLSNFLNCYSKRDLICDNLSENSLHILTRKLIRNSNANEMCFLSEWSNRP